MGFRRTNLTEAKRLTTEEFAILAECAKDVFFFANFIHLIHPVRGKVKFELYDFQKSVLMAFLEQRFNVILKFRQAGITELISLFALWYAMFHPHKNVVIISIKDRVAKKVLRKIKFMYKNLPEFLKVKVINGRSRTEVGTASDMEFANGSIISSIPTTEEAGRSEAVSLLVIDEAAIVRWAERIWAASWPTLSTGGRAIVNSTAYGVGNFFHKLYTNATAGGNAFNPIRLRWQMHPERDWEWYRQQAEILGPRKTAQEIDGDFLTSGNTVFDLADIRAIEDYIDSEVTPLEISYNGMFTRFKEFDKARRYTIGADISTGRSNDFSSFSIMDERGEEYAAFKGRIPIDRFEKILVGEGRKHGNAVLAPESNDIGLGLAHNIQNHGYPNLYYSTALIRKKGESRPEKSEIPGWYTTKKNRPLIINELEEDIRNDTIIIKDKHFCTEAYTFIYDSRNRPVAMNKDSKDTDDLFADEQYVDDDIFAKAITNWVRKKNHVNKTVSPR